MVEEVKFPLSQLSIKKESTARVIAPTLMLLAFQFFIFTPPVVVEILPDEKLDAVPDQSLK